MAWQNALNIGSKEFICGWCNNKVASAAGFFNNANERIYICPHCDKPSVFTQQAQTPGSPFGGLVDHLPADVSGLFNEAKKCTTAACYTAAVLICRKLLMSIAVSQGAKPGNSFISYVEYLADNGYVPPNGKGWVDHIRKKGNEATHEIVLMTRDDAHDLISFAEMLLKFIYEFPNRVPTVPGGA